ncbi:MAG: ABC transporter permease [Candidatus Baltobacteraceae bacterium]
MWGDVLAHVLRHAEISFAALTLACALGVPLGVAAAQERLAHGPILGAAAIGRTLPSLALLTLMLPWLGVGLLPAVVALALLALPPIVVNADLAIAGVPFAALDAATGLGMTPAQRFTRVSVPLALPVAIAGIRTAAVEVIGSATLATFIGAGGLGDDIVRALQTSDMTLLLISALAVALMAFFAEFILARLAKVLEFAR